MRPAPSAVSVSLQGEPSLSLHAPALSVPPWELGVLCPLPPFPDWGAGGGVGHTAGSLTASEHIPGNAGREARALRDTAWTQGAPRARGRDGSAVGSI